MGRPGETTSGAIPAPVADLAPQLAALQDPIGRIIASAMTLGDASDEPLAEPYASYARDIAEAGRHLLALIAPAGGIAEAAREPVGSTVDLVEAARQAAAMLGPEAGQRAIAIALPVGQPPLLAAADPHATCQILLNLIGNAVRYAPAASTITISVAFPPGRVWVTVADEGPGLRPDEQARVFDRSERLGRRDDGGSGIGLFISRRLARSMGGDLRVESDAGRGSRFTLELPAA